MAVSKNTLDTLKLKELADDLPPLEGEDASSLETEIEDIPKKMDAKLEEIIHRYRSYRRLSYQYPGKKEEAFKELIELLKSCYQIKPLLAIEKIIMLISQSFCKRSPLESADSLSMLAFLRTLSQVEFESQITGIKNDKNKIEIFCNVMLSINNFDKAFAGTSLSFANIVKIYLERFATEKNDTFSDDYLPRLMTEIKTFIAALPAIGLQNPSVIRSLYASFSEKIKNEHVMKSIKETMLQYCKINPINPLASSLYYKLEFLNILYQSGNVTLEEKHGYYQEYFKNTTNTKDAMSIIHTLFKTNNFKDKELGYALLVKLLKVSDKILLSDKNPLRNPSFAPKSEIMRWAEVIQFLFKHAEADENVQADALYSGSVACELGWYLEQTVPLSTSTVNVNKEAADKELVELIPNKHYKAMMELVKKPVGISEEQINIAVKWWGDILRRKVSDSTIKAFFEYIATNANAVFSKLIPNLPGETENDIQISEKALKRKTFISELNRCQLKSKTGDPKGIFEEAAAREAHIDGFLSFVKWWQNTSRTKGFDSINELFGNAVFDGLMTSLPDKTEDDIQTFEKALKRKMLAFALNRYQFVLTMDYDAADILGDAAKEAHIDVFSSLPWKTNMSIVGNSKLKKGSITVHGQVIELVTAQTPILVTPVFNMTAQPSLEELTKKNTAAAATVTNSSNPAPATSSSSSATTSSNTTAAVAATTTTSSSTPAIASTNTNNCLSSTCLGQPMKGISKNNK